MNEQEQVTQVSETKTEIKRSRTCGCKDFYVARVTQNTASGYVTETPINLARAIKAKIDEKWTSEKIYSDDSPEEVINSYEGTDVELEVNALAPQDRAYIFGQLYEKGFLVKSADDQAPEVAIGWRERKLSGKYEFHLQKESARKQIQKKESFHRLRKLLRVHFMRDPWIIAIRFLWMRKIL